MKRRRRDHPGRWRVEIDPRDGTRTIYLPNGIVRRYSQETVARLVVDVLEQAELNPSQLSAETYELVRSLAGEEDWALAKRLVPELAGFRP